MRRGRILRIRYGVNPNSSSIGTDLSYLLLGSTAVMFLVAVTDATIRIWLRRRRRKEDAGK